MSIETIEYRGYHIKIEPDEFPAGPRDWDNVWTFYCFHRRYSIGDKHWYRSENFSCWDEFRDAIIEDEKPILIEPLFLYDHGGYSLATREHRGYDSGQVGFAFVTEDKLKWFGHDRLSAELRPEIYESMKSEILAYNQWANGEVYGYRVYDDFGEFVDSCYGHYGFDYCVECAKETVDSYRNERGALCIS